VRVWRAEHRGEQTLQPADQNVRLATALGKLLDLRVLRCELVAEERNFPFQSADVSVGEVHVRRDLSRPVVACRCRLSLVVAFDLSRDVCRALSRQVGIGRCMLSRGVVADFKAGVRADLSRQVVTCRGRVNLLDIGDVPGDRGRRDEILFAEGGFDSAAIEVTLGAIALHAPRRPWKPRTVIARQSFIDRQGVFTVGAGRALSRHVFAHAFSLARRRSASGIYPHCKIRCCVKLLGRLNEATRSARAFGGTMPTIKKGGQGKRCVRAIWIERTGRTPRKESVFWRVGD
jgi:hypothetical protein